MAVTSVWRIKGNIGKVILYVENEDKTRSAEVFDNSKNSTETGDVLNEVLNYVSRDSATEEQVYVSGVNCAPQNATEAMMKIKRKFNKLGGTTAYHGYQSFTNGEITPELAHQIGIDLATEVWGDRFQVVVATHLDKQEHLHNHFVINTVSFVDGRKYYRSEKDYQRMREVSDRLCLEHSLSVIHNPQSRGMNYGEWRAMKEGKPTVRGGIREAIDIAINSSLTVAEFYEGMQTMGYVIDNSGKHTKIKPPNYEHFFRLQSLGPGYTAEDIQRRIDNNPARTYPEYPKQELIENVLYKYNDIPGSFSIMGFRPLYQTYVWWKCANGHSWKARISDRTLNDKKCYYCEQEFQSIFLQLVVMLYANRMGLKVEVDSDERIGVNLSTFIPDLNLAIETIEKSDKKQREQIVKEHICNCNNIKYVGICSKQDYDKTISLVKEAFRSSHIFIKTNDDSDIEFLWKWFIGKRKDFKTP